jgi:hypothetical protein
MKTSSCGCRQKYLLPNRTGEGKHRTINVAYSRRLMLCGGRDLRSGTEGHRYGSSADVVDGLREKYEKTIPDRLLNAESIHQT